MNRPPDGAGTDQAGLQGPAALLDGRPVADAVEAGLTCAHHFGGNEVAHAIRYGMTLHLPTIAATGQTELADDGAGHVLDSLSLAIAGGLLGARDGSHAIPGRWPATLQFRDEFLAAADLLAGTC